MRFFKDRPINGDCIPLLRRDYNLGFVQQLERPEMPDAETVAKCWQHDQAVMLPAVLNVQPWQADIEQSHRLMEQTLESG
ncbi:MAG: hypothetical protein Q9M82_00095, partial [Mariprofundus sp.]|nr:hypothetical protein [Mariprofundus sp.]